jgi:alpha-beta hydrolase superfamily lysophospholipase
MARVTVPTLVIQADGDTGVFPTDAARIFTALGSTDKASHTLDGDHYFQAPESARDQVADLIVDWIRGKW